MHNNGLTSCSVKQVIETSCNKVEPCNLAVTSFEQVNDEQAINNKFGTSCGNTVCRISTLRAQLCSSTSHCCRKPRNEQVLLDKLVLLAFVCCMPPWQGILFKSQSCQLFTEGPLTRNLRLEAIAITIKISFILKLKCGVVGNNSDSFFNLLEAALNED